MAGALHTPLVLQRASHRLLLWVPPAFLAFSVLWKGGKSLETTWLLVCVAWLLTLAFAAARSKRRRVPGAAWGAYAVLVVLTGVSYLTSGTANYGLDEVLREGGFFLVTWWTVREAHASAARGEALLPRLMRTLAWTAAAACALGLAVYALQPVDRFVGSFFDFRFQTDYWPNAWGDFVLLSWPPLLWLSLTSARGSRNLRSLFPRMAGLGVLLGCLLLSYSRGSFLALVGQWILLALLAGAFLLKREHARRGKAAGHAVRAGAALLLTCGVAVATFLGGNALRGHFFPVQSVAEKATFTAAEGSSSIDERAAFWRAAWTLSHDRPWLGWGPYSFRFIQPRLQEGVLATSDHPHNVVLKMALERGWPAAAAYVLVFLLVAWHGLRSLWRLRRGRHPDAARLLGAGPPWSAPLFLACALTAIAGALAHSLIDYNLHFVGNGLPLWLLVGAVLAFDAPERRERQDVRTAEVLLASSLMLIAILEGQWLATSSLGRHAEGAGDAREALYWYGVSAPEIFSRDMHLGRANLLKEQGDYAAALAAVQTYLSLNAQDSRAWLVRADILRRMGSGSGALAEYRRAYAMDKWNHLDALEGIVTLEAATGKRGRIDARKAEYDALIRAYAEAILKNTHFIALSPNVERLGIVTEAMASLYPEDAATYRRLAAEAAEHAEEERGRMEGQRTGMLW